MKNLYDLKLNETTEEMDPILPLVTIIRRVPGGWIYTSYDKGTAIMASSFVPWNPEFRYGGPIDDDLRRF